MKSYADSRSMMRFKAAGIALLFGFVLLISGHASAATVGDDFNDNLKDKTLWGPDYVYHNGVLKEQNQRLGYTVSIPSRNYDYTFRPLITSRGPYNSDWEVQIDLFNSTKPSKNNQYSSYGISVIKCGNSSDEIYIELYATHLGGAPSRKGFYAELWTEDVSSGDADTLPLSLEDPLAATARLSFDSTAKIFTTAYDTGGGWVQFGSFGVSGGGGIDGNGDWTMADTDQFCIAVYGYSEHMPIAKGKVYGDDFQATGVTTPLTTRILGPNGGETVPAGELYTVEWEAPLDATKFKLQYSLDNGSTWKAIAPDFVTGSSYEWPVPLPSNNKRKCLVRVNAYWIGYDGNDVKIGQDVSDAPFTVEVLKLDAPNGGEPPLISGTQYPITWTTNPNVPLVKRVILSYTLDNGVAWKAINTSTDPSDDGNFLWTVPDVTKEKNNCKVKIVLKDASGNTLGSDVSDGVFTINPLPTGGADIISPNGGETWVSGEAHDITWETYIFPASVDLHYTSDGGTTWNLISSLQGSANTYAWTVPDVGSTKAKCKVRVTLKDDSENIIGSDVSDSFFTIQEAPPPMVVKVLSPNGGEIWLSGEAHGITWEIYDPAGAKVTLQYTIDGGAHWLEIAEFVTGTSYDWVVPIVTSTQAQCKVRVTLWDAKGDLIGSDSSDGYFTISSVKIISPNGGEIWMSGEAHDITWETGQTANPVARTDLYYTLNGGTSWNLTSTLVDNPGTYPWIVPSVGTEKTNCKVKVVLINAAANTIGSDQSDGFFTIQPAATP